MGDTGGAPEGLDPCLRWEPRPPLGPRDGWAGALRGRWDVSLRWCHATSPSGTTIAHSALPSGTAEPRRPGVRVPSPSRLPCSRGVFAIGDVRAAGRGALRELSSVFDRAADWAGWLVPLPPEGRDGLRSVAGARDGQDGGRGLHGCLSLKGVRGRPRLLPWDLRAIVN